MSRWRCRGWWAATAFIATFPQSLSPDESAALQRSAAIVRDAISSLGL
jgi:hypothetical protein